VSAGCSPAAIWCNSPPAAGCESPVGAEPFFCLRFPDVLVVILLPLIDLLVVNVSLARSRLIIPSFCRVNQDFHFGFPATIDYTSDRCFPHPFHPERLFLGRHKPFHFRVWYRDTLAGYLQDVLLDERALSRPYIERKGLAAMVRGHVKGDRNYTTELHKVLTLELLHRLLLDCPVTGDASKFTVSSVALNPIYS